MDRCMQVRTYRPYVYIHTYRYVYTHVRMYTNVWVFVPMYVSMHVCTSILGLRGRNPPDFGLGSCGRRGSWGHGRIVKHYCILSCTESRFESGDFSREIE